ncbi:MAG: MATE family efflux transporter [Candidatus Hydrogenedentes bacterium]|nr:MATE family efflux transporter [Candidatus Hydrogenedentota bacterium]
MSQHVYIDEDRESRWAGLSEVTRMAGPIILSSISWTMMQFVDTFMVSWLGETELAAVGSAGLWSYTMGTFIFGILGCVTTFVSQSLGRGRPQDCASYVWQGIYISIIAGVLAFALWPLSEPLFRLMRHSEAVTRLEVLYFNVRLFGYGFIAWQIALASFFQAVNRPKIPMVVAIVCNALNGVLDYLLIFGKFGFPKWGVAGAAIATIISLFLQVVMLQAIFMSKTVDDMYASRSNYRIDLGKMRELIRIGWAAGLQFFLDVANWGIFTGFIVGYFGEKSLAAHNAAVSLMHVSFMPAVGLNQAIAPIVGQWIGRNRPDRAKARTYTAMRLAIVYMSIMGLTFALFGHHILRDVFKLDPEIVAIGHTLLLLAAIFQGFDAVNITVMGALRGAGDTRWMAIVMGICAYAVFLPAAVVLAFPLKLEAVGAWIGATIYIIGLSGLLFRRWHGERWRNIKIFASDLTSTH